MCYFRDKLESQGQHTRGSHLDKFGQIPCPSPLHQNSPAYQLKLRPLRSEFLRKSRGLFGPRDCKNPLGFLESKRCLRPAPSQACHQKAAERFLEAGHSHRQGEPLPKSPKPWQVFGIFQSRFLPGNRSQGAASGRLPKNPTRVWDFCSDPWQKPRVRPANFDPGQKFWGTFSEIFGH